MREGYKALRESLRWMGEHRPVDLTRQLGGVLPVGKHKVQCVEIWKDKDSIDYILRNADKQEHRQRVWINARYRQCYALSRWYEVVIEMSAGTHRIDATPEGGYALVSLYNQVVELKSPTIALCYKKLKELGGRLSRPTVTFSQEIQE